MLGKDSPGPSWMHFMRRVTSRIPQQKTIPCGYQTRGIGTSEMVGTRIGIISSSGMLRVTIPPRRSWLLILLEIAVSLVVVIWVYGSWTKMSLLFHVLFIWGIVTAFLALIYQLSVTQVVEFDSQRITVCKEIRGWERKKEYRVEDCSELEWSEG